MTGIRIVTLAGADSALDETVVEQLGSRVRGRLLHPNDAAYEEARRLWNGVIDKKPALIVRAADEADVIEAVNFARENGLLLAVRGGGHNVAGTASAEGGLVLDLSAMNGIEVDPERRTVRAGAGVTIGELVEETQKHGLATPMGVVSETGIAGLTLNGGIGHLRRKYGLSSDNLISADLVTADGSLLTASEEENAELFWAIRGGGGNFGVVTSFEYRLYPVGPEVMCAFVFYPGDRAKEVLRFAEEYVVHAPDEVSPLSFLGRVPRVEDFPEEWHSEQFVAFLAVYDGPVEEGEEALEPLRELGDPIVDFSGPMPYTEVQKLLDEDYPDGWRYYWKSVNVDGLGDGVIEALIEHAETAPSDHSTIDLWFQGGAMGRVGRERLRREELTHPARHRGELGREPGGRRGEHSVGQGLLLGPAALFRWRHVPQLPRLFGRGTGFDARRLRRELRAPGRPQKPVRSSQPLPPQPEHRAHGLNGPSCQSPWGPARRT